MSAFVSRLHFSLAALALGLFSAVDAAHAQSTGSTRPLKVGVMLPFTGTYAPLGVAIENGFKLYVQQQGGRIGGRAIDYVRLDDESDPSKASENASRLVKRDHVDVLLGTVHSGVAMAMAKVAKDTNTLLIVPNAGADNVTGSMCAPNIFRTSASNWQPAYAMGKVVADKGAKRVVTLTWKYAAGEESVHGFKEALEARGGKVVDELTVPYPNVEFQAQLAQIAAEKPDAVYVFFAGSGAVKFVKDYAAAGLKDQIPLYGPGFLTDCTLEAQGAAAQGLLTTLHYADGLASARNQSFRLDYAKSYKLQPDVYAVQGYDAAQLLAAGLVAVKGDTTQRDAMVQAMERARVDSPRGPFAMSKAHNPVQDIYLRQVQGRENRMISVAAKALADPARGCRMN